PVAPPGVLGRLALVRRRHLRRQRYLGIALAVGLRLPEPFLERAVAVRLRPETVPGALRAVQVERAGGDGGQRAEPGADVDVGLGAEPAQLFLQPGVLPQRLDEGADR